MVEERNLRKSLFLNIYNERYKKIYIIKALANILHLDKLFLCSHRRATVKSRS